MFSLCSSENYLSEMFTFAVIGLELKWTLKLCSGGEVVADGRIMVAAIANRGSHQNFIGY